MAIDREKRQRIMEKSRKLGHCICDPKKSCPCDIFIEKDVCLCAGEKLPSVNASEIRLTQYTHNAGCASKVPPAELEKILSRLPAVHDPRVVVGISDADDAGVYKISDTVTIVQTVDVFTPCVDDPYVFGQIAACNSVSDIYAMGGTPLTALSIISFPTDVLPGEVMYQIMKGGIDTLKEAQVSLIGGHSIKSDEIMFGFAVTGVIAPNKIISNNNLVIGDVLILTKPIGTGVISFAAQINKASKKGMDIIARSMTQLNRTAAEVMQSVGAQSCTDITGFGLFGHLITMARHSKTTVEIYADKIPIFEEALTLLRQGVVPGAVERNKEYVDNDIIVEKEVDPAVADAGFDAQTSGGLLISVAHTRAQQLVELLGKKNIKANVIGTVMEKSGGKINLITRQTNTINSVPSKEEKSMEETASCCSHNDNLSENKAAGDDIQSIFQEFMSKASSSGSIDHKQKELILYALVVLARCEECIYIHYKKALALGITPQELDEAAWLAVAIGGAVVKTFYDKVRKNLV